MHYRSLTGSPEQIGRVDMRAQIIARYTEIPRLLLRVQGGSRVLLRDYAVQQQLGRTSFDFTLGADGLVRPAPASNEYIGPNGMSLRPPGKMFEKILDSFREDALVFRLPQGTKLPPYFVLLHERSDHFSLQTAEAVTPTVLNQRMTAFLKQFPRSTVGEYNSHLIMQKY